jgi:hypothetical protein
MRRRACFLHHACRDREEKRDQRPELPGIASFADIAANLADGPSGAVLTIPDEGTITLLGVPAAGLSEADFVFV